MSIESSTLSIDNKLIFETLVNESNQGISVADINGNYVFVNPYFCKLVGYTKPELLTMSDLELIVPQQSSPLLEAHKTSNESIPKQTVLRKKSGDTFTAEIVKRQIQLASTEYVISTVQDITNRIATEKALRENEKRNSMIMQIANDGVWDCHIDTGLVAFDERYYTMAGYEKNEFPFALEEWQKRVHKDDYVQATTSFDSYLTGTINNYDIEFRFLRKDSSYMWIRGQGKIVERDEKGAPLRVIGTHSDISIQKEHEEKMIHQAHFDSLTFLPNRFLSLDRLTIACEDAKRNGELVALLFLDLDDFKKVNDTLGHEIGDQLLIDAAERLMHVVRSVDTVGRLGGDEFVVILRGLKDSKEAQPIVENLLRQFRDMFVIDSRELLLTTSVGIAVYPNDSSDASELLRFADSAMYAAKECGRNTYYYYTKEMNECAQRRLAIEEQLHGALARNEFYVHYQPKIDLNSSRIMGAEALIRWYNPRLGNIPPDEFISIAEHTGVISQLGLFVLQESLKQTAIWQKKFNQNFQIAVNLSPRQFRDMYLIDIIKASLKQTGVSPESLELEITEGVLLSGHNNVEQLLESITRLGIKMAMDDFGTGYSSLSYLQKYPFDVLKIDRSFINEMTDSYKGKALIKAVISMSHALNLKVVAEGIETKEQLNQLKGLSCDFGQGYLFSKPLCVEEMSKLLTTQTNTRHFVIS